MEKQLTPRMHTQRQSGKRHTSDRWLLVGSVVLHLIVFLLLPTFTTEAKQPRQLIIEIVKPVVKRKPVKQSGVKNPKPAAKNSNTPVTDQPAKTETPSQSEGAVAPAPESPKIDEPLTLTPDNVANHVPDETQTSPSEVTTTAPIPEMMAVPTHQPIVTPPPVESVVEESEHEPTPDPVVEQPAPKVEVQPTLPAPASSTGNTTPPPTPTEAATVVPKVVDEPAGGSVIPEPTTGSPVVDLPGQPESGVEESAGPPAPTALELGLLGEYGDAARKKIRMLVRMPEKAREQGMKGKCKFEFELRSDGTIVGIKVLSSSSHPVLDEECLEATRVAAPFKRFPGSVSVESWKFEMEIAFPTY